MIELKDAVAGYGGSPVLRGLDLSIPEGRVTALCGPNGCGKSTALAALRAALPLTAGTALLKGRPVGALRPKALAREIAMLGQHPVPPEDLTVRDLVALGRYAYRTAFGGLTPTDRAAIDEALDATACHALADRPIVALSGGQLQRAWLAMTVAQQAPVLLLDEPTNHLDMGHALAVLDLVRRLARERGRTVAIVLHDLNLAASHADRIVLMMGGRVIAEGAPEHVLRADIIETTFATRCAILTRPETGTPLVVPLGTFVDC